MRCGTCRFWDARYPSNADLGVCAKAGVLIWEAEAAIVMRESEDFSAPTSDFAAVRTIRSFGCVEHTPTDSPVRTLDRPR